jgi:hypothetical protein
MKSFRQIVSESDALSLEKNHSLHFSKKSAMNKAQKLHSAGHKNIKLDVHPNGLYVLHHGEKENIKEDGMGAGAVSAGPTNIVSGGAIAGTGGKGGEPGVSRKRNPILSKLKRKPPQF